MTETVLDIRNLTVELPAGADRPQAVSDVTFSLQRNEILCVVGESGSGKSVTARAVMGLLAPRVRVSGGQILFLGENLLHASPARLRQLRGAVISMIFQEPMTALNPLKTVGDQIEEVIAVHTGMPKLSRRARILELFEAVQLPEPAKLVHSYPHQLSGGQRQRAMIATALALEPAVLIADEPTTALDVTVQAQILDLLGNLREQFGLAMLFISHDLAVVSQVADRVAVMRNGLLLEEAPRQELFSRPLHPYTRSLLGAVPTMRTALDQPLATLQQSPGTAAADMPLEEPSPGHYVRVVPK